MQRAIRRLVAHEAQMIRMQRRAPLAGERRWPCNALSARAWLTWLTRRCAARGRVRAGKAWHPSEPAGISGGALPMDQRFFIESGMTSFTRVMPAGSGGR